MTQNQISLSLNIQLEDRTISETVSTNIPPRSADLLDASSGTLSTHSILGPIIEHLSWDISALIAKRLTPGLTPLN